MDALPPKVTPETVVQGFDAAYGRLIVALEHEQDPEDVFIPLFETLNWTDLLLILEDKGEIEIAVSASELKALKWARGHSHHAWGKILEIGDIEWPQPLTTTNRWGSGPRGPTVVLGWRWVEAERLNDTSHPDNRDAYVALMDGKPAHEILGRFRDGLSGLR